MLLHTFYNKVSSKSEEVITNLDKTPVDSFNIEKWRTVKSEACFLWTAVHSRGAPSTLPKMENITDYMSPINLKTMPSFLIFSQKCDRRKGRQLSYSNSDSSILVVNQKSKEIFCSQMMLRYVHAFLAILTPHLQTSITYRCH